MDIFELIDTLTLHQPPFWEGELLLEPLQMSAFCIYTVGWLVMGLAVAFDEEPKGERGGI